jgi:predicted HTH transcriptional regulator
MHSDVELLRLIDAGEGVNIEFKRLVHSPEKIAKSIVAFANTSGGVILIGVDDDKRIVGVDSEKETVEILYEASTRFCDPPVQFETDVVAFKGRDVLAVIIEESDEKPHYHLSETRDPHSFKKIPERKVYLRNGSQNTAATREVAQLMASAKRPVRISFGDNERTLFRYLDAYHRITLHEYSRLVNISNRRAMRILISLVRAGVIRLHTEGKQNYYTLVYPAT